MPHPPNAPALRGPHPPPSQPQQQQQQKKKLPPRQTVWVLDQSAEKSQDAERCNHPAPNRNAPALRAPHPQPPLPQPQQRQQLLPPRQTVWVLDQSAEKSQDAERCNRPAPACIHLLKGCRARGGLTPRPSAAPRLALPAAGLHLTLRQHLAPPSSGASPRPPVARLALPACARQLLIRRRLPRPAQLRLLLLLSPFVPSPGEGEGAREGEMIVFFSCSNIACFIKSFAFYSPSPPHTHPSTRPRPARRPTRPATKNRRPAPPTNRLPQAAPQCTKRTRRISNPAIFSSSPPGLSPTPDTFSNPKALAAAWGGVKQ